MSKKTFLLWIMAFAILGIIGYFSACTDNGNSIKTKIVYYPHNGSSTHNGTTFQMPAGYILDDTKGYDII